MPRSCVFLLRCVHGLRRTRIEADSKKGLEGFDIYESVSYERAESRIRKSFTQRYHIVYTSVNVNLPLA